MTDYKFSCVVFVKQNLQFSTMKQKDMSKTAELLTL